MIPAERMFLLALVASASASCACVVPASLLSGEEMTAYKPFYCLSGGRPAVRSFHFIKFAMR
jgi:hypothetical protein